MALLNGGWAKTVACDMKVKLCTVILGLGHQVLLILCLLVNSKP